LADGTLIAINLGNSMRPTIHFGSTQKRNIPFSKAINLDEFILVSPPSTNFVYS